MVKIMIFISKVTLLSIIAFSSFQAIASSGATPELTLVVNGKSDYTIVIPDPDTGDRVRKAAELLQSILQESTGCKLPIVKESDATANSPHIYLGKTNMAERTGLPVDKLKDWTFCKRVIGKDIFLLGYDASANIQGSLQYHDREYLFQLNDQRLNEDIKDRSYKEFLGTYKAVSSFLEKQLGVRFLLPGPNGLHVPKHKELKVDGDIDFVGSARFPFCYGRSYGDITVPNNHNEIPYYKNYGGHSFLSAVPPGQYAESHPEYYVLVNGERRPYYSRGGHLCISNSEVQELMMDEFERQFESGFKWVQLGQTDGYVACECAECKALAGEDKGEALWIVYRKIAEEMKKRRPDKKLVILAYAVTKNPPKTFNTFPDNVIIELCTFREWPKMLETWKRIKTPKLAYIYNWGMYHPTIFCPKRSPAYLAKQLRLFAENDIVGIYKCDWGEALGLDGPAYYVYSKLLYDPYADYQKLADDFYRAAYGEAYPVMKKFFTLLHARLEFNDGSSVVDLMYKVPSNPREQIKCIFQPGIVSYMDKLLYQSLRIGKDPKVQARLKLVKREFDFLKSLLGVYACYDAYEMTHSREAVELLDGALKKHDQLIDSWYDENGKMKQEPGFDWPFFYNLPKDVIKDGGGSICSPYPGLRRRMPEIRKEVNLVSPPE